MRVDVDTEALAGFGMLYLPLPIVDVYAKAGLARIDSDLRASGGLRLDRSETGFAWGVGAGIGLGNRTIRAEHERFEGGRRRSGLRLARADVDVPLKKPRSVRSLAATAG